MKTSFYALLFFCLALPASATLPKHGQQKKCRTSGDASFFRDEGLSTKVSAKLQFNRSLAREQIDVKSSGGVVTLSGNVLSHDRIALAGKVAGDVGGVRCVINLLKVGPPPIKPSPAAKPVPEGPEKSGLR